MRDAYHDIVITALQKDGWFITHDPFIIPAGKKEIQIDLGAERLVAAQKGKELIAVEIKSFKSTSHIYEFYRAIGQFEFYAFTLEPVEPERLLFLAVPEGVYESFFQDPHIIQFLETKSIRILVYNIEHQSLSKWIR